MPNAELIFRDKFIYSDGAIREMVIWKLPEADAERPHALKYSLFYGFPGSRLIGYDNELGKGDHRHYGGTEDAYPFSSVELLMSDFEADINRLRSSQS
jgi:hypothetical protein